MGRGRKPKSEKKLEDVSFSNDYNDDDLENENEVEDEEDLDSELDFENENHFRNLSSFDSDDWEN